MFTCLQVKSAVRTERTYRPVTPRLTHGTAHTSWGAWGVGPAWRTRRSTPPPNSHSLQNIHPLTWNSGINRCFFFLRASSLVYIT